MSRGTDPKRLRGGLFGCGMISEFHLRAWQRIPEVEIVAIGNRTLSAAERRRDAFAPAARVFSDFETLLRETRPDFVDILTPPELHLAHIELASRHTKAIICQKPVCDAHRVGEALAQRLSRQGIFFALHENHRLRPWFQTFLDVARPNGPVGRPRFVRWEQLEPITPGEAYKLTSTRGNLFEYGTHLVDMMLCLMGAKPDTVSARLLNINPSVAGESLSHVTFGYPEATAVIDIAWKPFGGRQTSVLLIGERGEAHFEGTMTRGGPSRVRVYAGDGAVLVDESRVATDDYVESFYLFQRATIDALCSGRSAPVTFQDGLDVLAVTDAAYRSAARGAVVRIDA